MQLLIDKYQPYASLLGNCCYDIITLFIALPALLHLCLFMLFTAASNYRLTAQ